MAVILRALLAILGGTVLVLAWPLYGSVAIGVLLVGWRLLGLRRCHNCKRWTADRGGFIIGYQTWNCCSYCVEDVLATIKGAMFKEGRKLNEIRRMGAFNERTGERGIMEPWQEER